jgi:hypothetical protein
MKTQKLANAAECKGFGKPDEVREFPQGKLELVKIGLAVKMDDGTLIECKPGDVSFLPSGHDAWTVGKEPAVVIDFQGMLDYAKAH